MKIVKMSEIEKFLIPVDMLVKMHPETPHCMINNGDLRSRLLNVKSLRLSKSTHRVAEGKE